MAYGRLNGLVSGLGAASADGIFGIIAAFGLAFISDLLIDNQTLLRLFGGAFLIYLGFTTLRSKPASEAAETRDMGGGLFGAYLSTFFLTLTNPLTIITFTGIMASSGITIVDGDYTAAVTLVVGVTVGSALWWLTLSGGVSLFRSRFNERWLLWVNRLSGIIILLFGAGALVSLL